MELITYNNNRPFIKDTNISLAEIAKSLQGELSIDNILKSFPSLTLSQAIVAFLFWKNSKHEKLFTENSEAVANIA